MKRLTTAFLVSISAVFTSGAAKAAAEDPLQIIVSLKDQQARVFQGTREVTSSNISSGKRGHRTPTGIFSVLQKNRYHRSNIYSGGTHALHAATNLVRHSLACI